MMNKLRKKSSSNRSLDKASREERAPPQPTLDYIIPDRDYRSSLILPDLGRRFSLLARANQPELVKAKLAELRATGGADLTREEEELVLEELNQRSEGRQPFNAFSYPSSSSSNPRGSALSPIQTGDHHSGPYTSPSAAATSPVADEVIHSPSSRSLFGAGNRDIETMRKASRSASNRSLTSSAGGEPAGKGKRRTAKERASTTEVPSSKDDLGLPTSPLSSTFGSSPAFESTVQVSPEEPAHSSPPTSSVNGEPTSPSSSIPLSVAPSVPFSSRTSHRKSLLDSLSPEQMKRVSSTLAQLEQSFFPSPASNASGLPSPNDLSRTSSRTSAQLPTVPEPTEEDGDAQEIISAIPKSSSDASSLASAATGGSRTLRGVKRSGSISASGERLTGYIPGMPRPITPQSRGASSTSSTPRFGTTPTQITTSAISPLTPSSPSPHVRSSSVTSPRRFESSYASSTLSSRQSFDDPDVSPSELDPFSLTIVLPSSSESIRTLDEAAGNQAVEQAVASGSLSPDRSRRSLAPSPEFPSSSLPVFVPNGSRPSPLSSVSSFHPESVQEESELEREEQLVSEGAAFPALDSWVSLVPSPIGLGITTRDESSRSSSSYGHQVPTNFNVPTFQNSEEHLASRQSSILLLDDPAASTSPTSAQFRYPPPSTSSMAIHGHDTMRFSTVSGGPLSSYRESFDGRPTSSAFSPDQTHAQLQHPLHHSVYENPETAIQALRASLASTTSLGSSFHDEMVESLAETGETSRGLSVLLDNGRKNSYDQMESVGKGGSPRDAHEDLKTLGGLTLLDVAAIQERLVKDRVEGTKGDWVGGVGLGGAGPLLSASVDGAPVEVQLNGESRSEYEREENGQDVWSHSPSDLSLPQSGLGVASVPHSAPSFTTAGSEYSDTFPQTKSHSPSHAASHRSYNSGRDAVGYHRPRPAHAPALSPSPLPHGLVDSSFSPSLQHQHLKRAITPTTPKDLQLTPSTPTNSKFSPSMPSVPLSPAIIADPDFILDYRAKIEAADSKMRELKKSPSMPKMGLKARKSIKRMPKNLISSPQLISTTARVNTTDLPSELQTQSLSGASGASVSQRIRKMSKTARDRPESPPPLPTTPRSPIQPAFYSRPSLDQVVRQASQTTPSSFVFPNRVPSPAPPSPLPFKTGKTKRSFLGLLRSRKSSDVASSSPPLLPVSKHSVPRSPPPFFPHSPVVDLSRPVAGQTPPTFSSPFAPSERSVRTPKLSHMPGSRDEGSIHAFLNAASDLGIDPAEVNQLLSRSTSTTARKYSSIRSNSISNSVDLSSPPLTRVPSQRSMVARPEIVEEEGHQQQQPVRSISVVGSEGGGLNNHLNASSSVRSALDRAGSTRSKNGKGVLRRTLVFASDMPRMSSYHPGVVSEDGAEVLADGGGMPSPLGSRFNLRHSTSSSRPPRSPSDSSFFRGAAAAANRGPPPSPSESSFIRAGHSSTHASLYDLYYDENDPEHEVTQSSIVPSSQSVQSLAQPGNAVEILEMENGDVVYSVLQGLRDMDDLDDEDWDARSDVASTMDRPPSSLIDEPVQLTFRGQHSLVEPPRSVFKPHRPARPETKVFYSSSKQVADLIAEISRSHDAGQLEFAASPSPTSNTFPSSQHTPATPLNLSKRSISIRRRSQNSTKAALAPPPSRHDRGISDAPSFTPSQMSMETNLDRLMGSLLQHGEAGGDGEERRRTSGAVMGRA